MTGEDSVGTRLLTHWQKAAGPSLVLGLAGWLVIADAGSRNLWPKAGLLVGCVISLVAARLAGRHLAVAVPALIAVAPLITVAITGQTLLGGGPIGHSGASGILYLLAGAGALTAARVAHRRNAHRLLSCMGGTWLVMPFLLGATAASLGAVTTVAAMVLVDRPRRVQLSLVAGGALVAVAVTATVVLGVTSSHNDRGSPVLATGTTVTDTRIASWIDATRRVHTAPLLGANSGPPLVFDGTSPTAIERSGVRWSHSEFLQMTSDTGLIGGTLLLALVAWTLAVLWKRQPGLEYTPTVIAIVIVMINAAIDNVWHFPVIALSTGALIGSGLARPPRLPLCELTPADKEGRRLMLPTALLGLVVILPITPTNAPLTVDHGTEWLGVDGGFALSGRGYAASALPPEQLYRRWMHTGELTIEMIVATTEKEQTGPARIASISADTENRNLTVGQDFDALVVRLRTTETGQNATEHAVEVPGVFNDENSLHVMVTSDLQETRVYIEGDLRSQNPGPGGTFDNWDLRYPLIIGNEATTNRPWAGQLSLLALYDHAVSEEEVRELYRTRHDSSAELASAARTTALALYTFEEISGLVVHDRSEFGVGGELDVPARIRPEPTAGVWSFREVTTGEWLGLIIHWVAFTGWMVLALLHGRRWFNGRAFSFLLSGIIVLIGISSVVVAAMWPRDDAPDRPEAVVVLGGAGLDRPQLGRDLSDEHDAQLVLSSGATEFAEELGVPCGSEALCIDPVPETTAGEARTIATLANERGWESVTVATSRFHTTRSRLLFRQCFGDQVQVVGTPPPDVRDPKTHLREAIGILAAITVRRAC